MDQYLASSDNYNNKDDDYHLEDDGSDGSEDDFDNKKKPKRKQSRGKKSGKDLNKWDEAFDENGMDEEDRNLAKAQKKKRVRKPRELLNPNVIKTSNKLIGEIENADLYDSDDAFT